MLIGNTFFEPRNHRVVFVIQETAEARLLCRFCLTKQLFSNFQALLGRKQG